MEFKRNKSGLLKRIHSIIKISNDLNLQLDGNRTGNNYEMIVFDSNTNERIIENIIGFKSKTKALHSGFDYFERVILSLKNNSFQKNK